MNTFPTLIIGDTEYTLTPAYIEGALDNRDNVHCNPYQDGTQNHSDWADGHVNDSEGKHGGNEIINNWHEIRILRRQLKDAEMRLTFPPKKLD